MTGSGRAVFDIGEEQFVADGAADQAGCNDAVMAQAGDEGRCHPVPVRHAADHTLAAWTATIAAGMFIVAQSRHPDLIRGFPSRKTNLRRVQLWLPVAPILPRSGDVGRFCSAACWVPFFASAQVLSCTVHRPRFTPSDGMWI